MNCAGTAGPVESTWTSTRLRLERALTATTLAELDELLADLPIVRIADPAGMRPSAGSSPSEGPRRWPAMDRAGTDSSDDGNYAAKGRALSKRLGTTAWSWLTVVMVLAAVVLALAASWAWARSCWSGGSSGCFSRRLGGLRGGGPASAEQRGRAESEPVAGGENDLPELVAGGEVGVSRGGVSRAKVESTGTVSRPALEQREHVGLHQTGRRRLSLQTDGPGVWSHGCGPAWPSGR